jgi:hypothetical protein
MLADDAGADPRAVVAEAPDADPDLGTEDPAEPGASERREPAPSGSPAPSIPSGRRPARPNPPRRRDSPVA